MIEKIVKPAKYDDRDCIEVRYFLFGFLIFKKVLDVVAIDLYGKYAS